MAFNELYVQTTGNDVNAGSTTADAASVTSTNGNWSTVTNAFVATGGTPFAAVNVGEWVSLYIDAATLAVFIAQIISIDVGGLGFTVSTTARYGTAPTTSATARSAKVGGAWASLAGPISALGTAAVYTSTRVNIKAGTYANTTTGRTFATPGTTTAPLWFRGYTTTIGDIDLDNSLTKPVITFTTAGFTVSAVHQLFSNLNISGAKTSGSQFIVSGATVRVHRCRIEATGANVAASAVSITTGTNAMFSSCWLKATSTATRVCQGIVPINFLGCVIEGGGHGLDTDNDAVNVSGCVFLSNGNHGINVSASADLQVKDSTFYIPTNDGIHWAAAPSGNSWVIGCVFRTCVIGLNQASGANTNNVLRIRNRFSNCGTNEVGVGDAPSFRELSDSVDPFVSAPTNLTLAATDIGAGLGFPGTLENETYAGPADVGAVQRTPAGAATPALFIPVE